MLRIEHVGLLHADARVLIEEVQAEYVRLYGGPDHSPMDAAVFEPPSGAFFVGYLDDTPLVMGGWRTKPGLSRLGGRALAEIKRMYVAPAGRRSGLARALLTHLEVTAAEAGCDVMVLETGTQQPEAIALYESAGYEPVVKFGYYASSPLSRCFGKRI